jgi:chorismate mutase/prephenate dehydratase
VEVATEPAKCPPEIPCKTSLLLATGNHPGDLGQVLTEFTRRNINLTKLESRPIPSRPWQYRFYLDLVGHAAAAPLSEALKSIAELTDELRILGTYPRADSSASAPPGATHS